jgi:hypothetical protein
MYKVVLLHVVLASIKCPSSVKFAESQCLLISAMSELLSKHTLEISTKF